MTERLRGARDKENRRENILDAAEVVFVERGFDRTPMDEIARRAGISRALLYVYFTDKAAIMRGIMLRAIDSMCRRFEQAVADGATGLAQLRGIGRAYYAFSRDESDYFDVLTNMNTFPASGEDDEQVRQLRERAAYSTRLMVEAMENGLSDGSLAADRVRSPLQTAYFLQGALHGVIMQTRGPHSPVDEGGEPGISDREEAEQLVLYAIDMLGRAIRSD